MKEGGASRSRGDHGVVGLRGGYGFPVSALLVGSFCSPRELTFVAESQRTEPVASGATHHTRGGHKIQIMMVLWRDWHLQNDIVHDAGKAPGSGTCDLLQSYLDCIRPETQI